MREKLQELRPPNGAADAARWLESLSQRPGNVRQVIYRVSTVALHPSARGAARRAALRARAVRAWVFVRTIPRTVARLVTQTLTLPRPHTIVLAFGADEPAIRDALNRARQPPERVLLVTDSLAIGDVWRAGTGVEHVPAAGERQAELAGDRLCGVQAPPPRADPGGTTAPAAGDRRGRRTGRSGRGRHGAAAPPSAPAELGRKRTNGGSSRP